jgi:RimJ/RimL family protein N-acetyltransferase
MKFVKIHTLQYQPLTPFMDKSDPRCQHRDCQNLLDVYEEYYRKNGFHPPWHAYLFFDQQVAVGVCGFTGPPIQGRVELAYYIFKEYEGRGVGTRVCAIMVEVFNQLDTADILYARTAPEQNASTKILIRNDFRFSSMVQDHEIGDAWEWVYHPRPSL